MPTGGLCPNFPEKTLLPTSIFLSAIFLSSLFVEVDDRPAIHPCSRRACPARRNFTAGCFSGSPFILTFLRP